MLDITITVVCLYDYILHSFSYFQLPNINEIINLSSTYKCNFLGADNKQ